MAELVCIAAVPIGYRWVMDEDDIAPALVLHASFFVLLVTGRWFLAIPALCLMVFLTYTRSRSRNAADARCRFIDMGLGPWWYVLKKLRKYLSDHWESRPTSPIAH